MLLHQNSGLDVRPSNFQEKLESRSLCEISKFVNILSNMEGFLVVVLVWFGFLNSSLKRVRSLASINLLYQQLADYVLNSNNSLNFWSFFICHTLLCALKTLIHLILTTHWIRNNYTFHFVDEEQSTEQLLDYLAKVTELIRSRLKIWIWVVWHQSLHSSTNTQHTSIRCFLFLLFKEKQRKLERGYGF